MLTTTLCPLLVLQVWGWEADGSLCAFKDDQQQPFPMHAAYRTTMLAFTEAPVCSDDPVPTKDNSEPDKLGCLWGWQLSRNCAFRDEKIGEPLYYSGYKRLCNATASQVRAAHFNEDPEAMVKEM